MPKTEIVCPHNEGVVCETKDCANCGWNPEEQQRRDRHRAVWGLPMGKNGLRRLVIRRKKGKE